MHSTDHLATLFPVSIKGVVFDENRVLLLKNERDEWELPGGKLERGEPPEVCCEREFREETQLRVQVGQLLDVWVYPVTNQTEVFIVTYGCHLQESGPLRVSNEHKEAAWFAVDQLPESNTPRGYIRSIRHWYAQLQRKP